MKGLGIVVKTTDEQEERLERLLPWHQKHMEEDGSYPHSNWITSDMLECLVNIHARELVDTLLDEEERRQGIAAFRMSSFGDISHLYANNEPPAFAARFCEAYGNEEQRHD